MRLPTLVVHHPAMFKHDPGIDHPETPERLARVIASLEPAPPDVELCTSDRLATAAELHTVHTPEYVDHILSFNGRSRALDDETRLSEHSVPAALAAAGASIELVDRLFARTAHNGFALVRPPGHHATKCRAMGYCVFNNVALAAERARGHGCRRTLIVDFDVHHGNGTEEIFRGRQDVLFCSIHQADLFPASSGHALESDRVVNIPLAAGAGDQEFLRAMHVIASTAGALRPEVVLVSAGFDAHVADPMSELRVTTSGFAQATRVLKDLAETHASGRLGMFLEGGYDYVALAESVRAVVEVLADDDPR